MSEAVSGPFRYVPVNPGGCGLSMASIFLYVSSVATSRQARQTYMNTPFGFLYVKATFVWARSLHSTHWRRCFFFIVCSSLGWWAGVSPAPVLLVLLGCVVLVKRFGLL